MIFFKLFTILTEGWATPGGVWGATASYVGTYVAKFSSSNVVLGLGVQRLDAWSSKQNKKSTFQQICHRSRAYIESQCPRIHTNCKCGPRRTYVRTHMCYGFVDLMTCLCACCACCVWCLVCLWYLWCVMCRVCMRTYVVFLVRLMRLACLVRVHDVTGVPRVPGVLGVHRVRTYLVCLVCLVCRV